MQTSDIIFVSFSIGFVVGFIVALCMVESQLSLLPQSTCELLDGEFIGDGWISCNEGFTVNGKPAPICIIEGEPHKYKEANGQIYWIPKQEICGEVRELITNTHWTYYEGETDKEE